MATLLRRRRPVVIGVPRSVIGLAALDAELGRLSGTVPMFHRDKTRELRCPAWTCPLNVPSPTWDSSANLTADRFGDRCDRDTA